MKASVNTFAEAVGHQFSTFHKRLALRDVKLGKIDERFDNLESNLGNQFASQEVKFDQKFAKFEELVRSMANQMEQDHSRTLNRNSSQSPASSGAFRNNHGVTRLAKLILPRFSGDQLKDWLFRIEQFFDIHRPPDVDKVNIASVLMEDVAAQWHQSVQDSEYGSAIIKSWTAYRELLIGRFKEDPFEKMRALFKKWREEDLIERRTRKEELSPIEKYFASKQSFLAQDSLTLLHATGQNTSLGDKPSAEIVEHEVNDPARASDPLDLMVVAIEGSSDMSPPYMVLEDDLSLDSRTKVIQHQITTNSTLDSSTNELVKEPLRLAESALATIPSMVKDSMVFQVSNSNLEPFLEVHIVAVGVGDVRQMEFGLDDAFDRIFESLQAPLAKVWSDFSHESVDVTVIDSKQLKVSKSWMFKYKATAAKKRYPDIQCLYLAGLFVFGKALELIPGAEKCVVLDSQQANATTETRPAFMAANWHHVLVHFASGISGFSSCTRFLENIGHTIKFLELLSHFATVLKLNFMLRNTLQRLFLLEAYGRVLDEFLSRCQSINFPLVFAATDIPSPHCHVVIRVIQVWDPGGVDPYFLRTNTTKEFSTFYGSAQSYTESLSDAEGG